MKYFNPSKVKSPKDLINNVKILFDGGQNSVSIAEIEWEGKKQLGIRWNVARRERDDKEKIKNNKICVGMPSSHGYPVWFLLPEEIFDKNSEIGKVINEYFEK